MPCDVTQNYLLPRKYLDRVRRVCMSGVRPDRSELVMCFIPQQQLATVLHPSPMFILPAISYSHVYDIASLKYLTVKINRINSDD